MMKLLTERCVYSLPDWTEVVAQAGGRGYRLYNVQNKNRVGNEPPDYEVDVRGRILAAGVLTQWTLDDLTDTGWTGQAGDEHSLHL